MSLRPSDYQAAKASYKPMRRTPMARGTKQMKRSRMKQRRNARDTAWSKAVLERDGHRCQWLGGCHTGDDRIDPHHKAERSQRPDLKYDISIGIALCRTHHDWIPLHRAEAIAMGLLLEETYEKAMKNKAVVSHVNP